MKILQGDCREKLKEIPDGTVQCCVTSPPYWNLRDYGVPGQIGMENTPEEYLNTIVGVFREIKRILKPKGTLWLNLGDTYNSPTPGGRDRQRWPKQSRANHQTEKKRVINLKPKDLVGIPWRVAFALQEDGWWLRQDIIWSKPNPMPESVKDRCTKAHEYLFLLSKSQNYFFDAEATKEPVVYGDHPRNPNPGPAKKRPGQHNGFSKMRKMGKRLENSLGTRNKRSVWTISTAPFPDAHFATYPTELVKPCILAGSAPGDTVIDPFHGSGTTGQVAIGLGRGYVGVELNPEYIEISKKREYQTGLF